MGVIARTAAAGATLDYPERDLRFLRKIWAQVPAARREDRTQQRPWCTSYGDLSLRVIRDHC